MEERITRLRFCDNKSTSVYGRHTRSGERNALLEKYFDSGVIRPKSEIRQQLFPPKENIYFKNSPWLKSQLSSKLSINSFLALFWKSNIHNKLLPYFVHNTTNILSVFLTCTKIPTTLIWRKFLLLQRTILYVAHF